jgi:prephenate dehydratase|eukprot:TRINITY_DN57501_c0_g1_i1.p1 TRINITY_DN57501_c0_g1~~TRINITY_DN57501_c0_g1_i1.p1  ORF type:complete len:348 (-),score=52.51 TRINITY_DN57501_c0_g1_i1:44-1087(-)
MMGDILAAKRARLGAKRSTAVFPDEEGSLAHVVAKHSFLAYPSTVMKSMTSFRSCFQAVTSGEADFAVIPIESSASGTFYSTYDLLVEHDVLISGELRVQELYCLCAKPGCELANVSRVLGHPSILDACSHFLKTWLPCGFVEDGLNLVATQSTTEAARRLADEPVTTSAAAVSAVIATKEVASRNKLHILKEDIGNESFVETRYVLVRAKDCMFATTVSAIVSNVVVGQWKRSICCALRYESVVVFKVLSCLAFRGIEVLKVATRPMPHASRTPPRMPGGMWDYLLYIDYAVPCGQSEEDAARLMDSLSDFAVWHRDFGLYRSRLSEAGKEEPPNWDVMCDLMSKC